MQLGRNFKICSVMICNEEGTQKYAVRKEPTICNKEGT